MAAALVGGAFLSGFINVAFDRFLTTDAVNLVLGKKLGPDLVQRLKTALLGAEGLVADSFVICIFIIRCCNNSLSSSSSRYQEHR
ncbi:uncharacterized protein DS421_12g353920 [Arachis hypogaea]|nr:uncharacterized protein DS421_12g353920 [Arachis hypogaea]